MGNVIGLWLPDIAQIACQLMSSCLVATSWSCPLGCSSSHSIHHILCVIHLMRPALKQQLLAGILLQRMYSFNKATLLNLTEVCAANSYFW